jgi:hypothetical protein
VFFYGFLDQPAPDEAGFADYLNRYEGLGVIPVPIIVSASDLGPDRVRTHEFLRYMKMFQTNQYRPNWTSDWGTAKFKYRSANGRSEVTAEDDGNYLLLKQDSTLIYQRAHGSNMFDTPSYIQNWPAYDSTRLFGTDPNRQYWLEKGSFRPADDMHLLSVPTNFEVTTSSFTTADYGYFEIAGVNQKWFDFLEELPGANTGTIYNLTNFKVINGAIIQVGRVTVNGQLFNEVLQEYPPFKKAVGGSSFVEYSVPVPVAPKVTLNFSVALADGSNKSDGVLYGVQINGQTQWKQTILPGSGWTKVALDLTALAGKTAKITLLTHPGLLLDAQFDWSCWKDLSIATDFSTNTKLQVQLPASATKPLVGDSATLESLSGQVAGVSLHVPGALTVFSKAPPAIQIGESLMDFPVTVWKASNEGLPIRFANDNSGVIGPVSSQGISKRAIAAIPPKRGLTLLTVPVTLPPAANSITFGYGLADPPPIFGSSLNYSGVTFIGRANGQEIFRQHVETAGWQQAQIDVRSLSGKPVLFELQVDAENNQLFDFSYFTNLTVQ